MLKEFSVPLGIFVPPCHCLAPTGSPQPLAAAHQVLQMPPTNYLFVSMLQLSRMILQALHEAPRGPSPAAAPLNADGVRSSAISLVVVSALR